LQNLSPAKALYIKLGEGGKWERECLEEAQTLRLDYRNVPHDLCLDGNWDGVIGHLVSEGSKHGAAKRHQVQIRAFYEAPQDVLWITFFANKLWWCFSKPEITRLSDRTTTRPVIDQWSSVDIAGQTLDFARLSGKLTKTQGFQGTICEIHGSEFRYLIDKVNGVYPPDVLRAKSARSKLGAALEVLLGNLHPKDFELLTDMIFREAGWRRVGEVGGTQKTLDLDLEAPVTRERYGVQIKAEADLQTFEKYCQDFALMDSFKRFYFVVHSPRPDLMNANRENGNVELLRPPELADLVVRYGLVDWLIQKAG